MGESTPIDRARTRTCWNCGYDADVRALDCIICGRPLGLRRRRIPLERHRGVLAAAVALTSLAFVASYIYPNIRFAREELAPRHEAPGIEFVDLGEAVADEAWRRTPPAETDLEWPLHQIAFRLPADGILGFTGDASSGTVLLPGWRLEYVVRPAEELPHVALLAVEGADALSDLRALADDEHDFLVDIYESRPDDFHLFFTAGARARLRLRLALKETLALPGGETAIRIYRTDALEGFLFGRPGKDRRIGLQLLVDGRRMDLVAEELHRGSAGDGVVRWLASVRRGRIEGAAGRLAEGVAASRTDRSRLHGALLLAAGMVDPGAVTTAREELERGAWIVRRDEARVESALERAATSVGPARQAAIAEAAGVGADIVAGILRRSRSGFQPELGPPAVLALEVDGRLVAADAIADCTDAADPLLAEAARRALDRLADGAPALEADAPSWKAWWTAARASLDREGGR